MEPVRPELTSVWLVRERDPVAIEGTLSIEADTLSFLASDPDFEKLEVPIREITGARRSRGSPVLTVAFPTPGGPRRIFVYFAKPPPLPGKGPSARLPLFRPPRGLERSAAALSLRAANKLLKREIDGWVRALRTR